MIVLLVFLAAIIVGSKVGINAAEKVLLQCSTWWGWLKWLLAMVTFVGVYAAVIIGCAIATMVFYAIK